MILTTYANYVLATNDDGSSSHYWTLVEGISSGDKKVVIHEYKDGILGWASGFDDVTQAKMYWSFLVSAKFDTKRARHLYVESL